jgi:hypothetical protein
MDGQILTVQTESECSKLGIRHPKLSAPTTDEVSLVNCYYNDALLERWIQKDVDHTLVKSLLRTRENVSVFEHSDLVPDFEILIDSRGTKEQWPFWSCTRCTSSTTGDSSIDTVEQKLPGQTLSLQDFVDLFVCLAVSAILLRDCILGRSLFRLVQ